MSPIPIETVFHPFRWEVFLFLVGITGRLSLLDGLVCEVLAKRYLWQTDWIDWLWRWNFLFVCFCSSLLVIQHPCWRKCSFAKRRHSFQTRAGSRLQAYNRSKSAFDARKNTFWPRSMSISFFLCLMDGSIIAHMFVFGNQKPPDLSSSFTPFRGRETSREKC